MKDLLLGLGLVLVLEGILFAFSPARVKDALELMNRLPNALLMKWGLGAVIIGAFLITLSKSM
jgi:uncharacterized protein